MTHLNSNGRNNIRRRLVTAATVTILAMTASAVHGMPAHDTQQKMTADHGMRSDQSSSSSSSSLEDFEDRILKGDSDRDRSHDRTCEDNPGCDKLDLVGNCCPTDDGVFLDCCGYRSPGDWEHKDDDEWWDSDKDGQNLKCKKKCRNVPEYKCVSACARPGKCTRNCVRIRREKNGKYSEMCIDVCQRGDRDDKISEMREDMGPRPQPTNYGTCYEHRQCRLAGLLGECCPTTDGVVLDCCKDTYDDMSAVKLGDVSDGSELDNGLDDTGSDINTNNDSTQVQDDSSGSTGSDTSAEGGTGDIVSFVTDQPEEAQCINNEKCRGLGIIEGYCCPAAMDAFLDCCPEADLYNLDLEFEGVIVKNAYELADYGYSDEEVDPSLLTGSGAFPSTMTTTTFAFRVVSAVLIGYWAML